ncbi:metallophosphoesterase 1 [Prunus yedoensis var. nudiflora]|uniref:Metallophosphoesterase 1 n=1 Tax=Prunus yedoensis var. nudiflora TaxID=2094558 RepID=A0A314UVA4_PRUYE|nr:metallophosphoesterase 1 [Prunus yedoensis var. nudiflora]
MAVGWKPLLPLIAVSALFIYEEWVSSPSCKRVPSPNLHGHEPNQDHPDDLKVMMVANLLLLGSEAGYFNLLFRDYYLSRFFTNSFRTLKPDMLLVLGDISARGYKLPNSKYISVIHQFQRVLGPFLGLPLHVVLGDRDIGECDKLSADLVSWVSGRFPGLDSAGCGAFEIGNVSFVSLNAVALLCGNNELRFSVEKVVESESMDFQMGSELEGTDANGRVRKKVYEFGWRENAMSSGSGPVLLLHFPLNQTIAAANYDRSRSSSILDGRGRVGTGPYNLLHKLPPNATEYIFQALKPRIVFSAHTQEFHDHFHPDGTREVTVPAMTWNARDDPGFVVAIFRRNKGEVSVSYCSLARESHALIAYVTLLILLVSMMVFPSTPNLRCLTQS